MYKRQLLFYILYGSTTVMRKAFFRSYNHTHAHVHATLATDVLDLEKKQANSAQRIAGACVFDRYDVDPQNLHIYQVPGTKLPTR